MNLLPLTTVESAPAAKTEASKLSQEKRDRGAVIENDWVPAIELSTMHHAQPVRLAGPLRPMWYVGGVKKLLFKVARQKQPTV